VSDKSNASAQDPLSGQEKVTSWAAEIQSLRAKVSQQDAEIAKLRKIETAHKKTIFTLRKVSVGAHRGLNYGDAGPGGNTEFFRGQASCLAIVSAKLNKEA